MKNISIQSNYFRFCGLLLSLFFWFNLTGCKGQENLKLGIPIPSGVQATQLADIVKNPKKFNEQKVLVEGVVAAQCATLCEFTLKSGLNKVTIFPEGFQLPKLTKGLKTKVWVLVTAGEENVVFSALGIQGTK